MNENVVRVGRRIRELRDGRGWTQGELASLLGRTQTAVSYWEAGKRAPGLDDLLDLARLFEVGVADLIPKAPTRPLPTLLRAVAEDVDAQQLAQELELFAREAERLPALPVKWDLPAAGSRDTADALLNAAGISTPPVPVHDLATGCGVRVLLWSFKDVDGLVVNLTEGSVIGVNRNEHPHRQRFTIAHELGHHLLRHADTFHVDFAGELSPAASGGPPGYDWRQERAANTFAANLLMPASLVRTFYKNNTDINALARIFDVSTAAMGFRLTDLRLRK